MHSWTIRKAGRQREVEKQLISREIKAWKIGQDDDAAGTEAPDESK